MKSWYQSKTIWVNVVTFAIAILTTLQVEGADSGSPLLPAIGAAVAVLNIVLRVVTTKAIGK